MSRESGIIVAAQSGVAIRSASDIADAVGACLGTAGLILTDLKIQNVVDDANR